MDSNLLWHQFVVPDKNLLSGGSVVEIISPLLSISNAQVILLSDLIGAVGDLIDLNDDFIYRNEFLEKIRLATQYDWAFFFLFEKKPSISVLHTGLDHRALLSQAELTIRLVDSQYVYFYFKNLIFKDHLMIRFPGCEYQTTTLNDLELPY